MCPKIMGSEPKRYLPQPQTSCATTLESPHKASAILSPVKYGTFVAKPSGAAPPLQRVEILLCQGQRRRCRSRSLARPFSAIVLGCDIAEGEGGTLLHSASDLVILTQVSVFAFKTCVYLSCIIVDMTLDAPKMKATFED